jgi:shikimate kinase
MTNIKKLILLCLFLHNSSVFCKNSIIVLYGCSSAGKTSISTELLRILPGEWKYIPSNQFKMANRNSVFWKEINATVAKGYNVIVDTHSSVFLPDPTQDTNVLITLLYCNPSTLIEHVTKRNSTNNPQTHRTLKAVFHEYCNKYKTVTKSHPHIDTLNKDELKNNYSFFVTFALKQIVSRFFNKTDQNIVYVAPMLSHYDCFINTGKSSITASAQKIKDELLMISTETNLKA